MGVSIINGPGSGGSSESADPTLVQLGDASIASPFTARMASTNCVLSIIRQGRCTLVTTLQVYKVFIASSIVLDIELFAINAQVP